MSSPSSPVIVNSRPSSSGSESSGSSDSHRLEPDELGRTLQKGDQEDFVRAIVNHALVCLYEKLGDDATYPHWTWKFGVDLRHYARRELIRLEDGRIAGTGCLTYNWVATRVPMDEDVDDGKNPRGGNGEIEIPIPNANENTDDNDSVHRENGIVDNVHSDEEVSLPSMIIAGLDDENDEVSLPSFIIDDGVRLREPSSNTSNGDNGVSLPHLTSNADADANGLSPSYDDSRNLCDGVSVLGLNDNNGGHINSSDDQNDEENFADDEDDGAYSPRFDRPPPILTNFQLMSTVSLPLKSSDSALFVVGSPSSGSDLSSSRLPDLNKPLPRSPCSIPDGLPDSLPNTPLPDQQFSRQSTETLQGEGKDNVIDIELANGKWMRLRSPHAIDIEVVG